MDESRKQFEEWFMDDVVGAAVDFPEFKDGEYVVGEVYNEQLYVMLQAMYMAWQASRAAIEIELPDSGAYDYPKQVVKALEEELLAAGIKVKE